MDDLLADLGPVRLKLRSVEHGVAPEVEGRSFLRLSDGTVVKIGTGDDRYLYIDHRTNGLAPCRIEFWEAQESLEGDIRGVVVMADAARLETSSPAERFPGLRRP